MEREEDEHRLDRSDLDEDALAAVAARLAPLLRGGDLLLLSGPLGAGKTAFVRALVRTRLGEPDLEVASPSFALCICYAPEPGPEIRHVDLYRIDDPDELRELGLEDGIDDAITAIEWPEHGGDFSAFEPLLVEIDPVTPDRRRLRIRGGRRWADRLAALDGDLP